MIKYQASYLTHQRRKTKIKKRGSPFMLILHQFAFASSVKYLLPKHGSITETSKINGT